MNQRQVHIADGTAVKAVARRFLPAELEENVVVLAKDVGVRSLRLELKSRLRLGTAI
jgi:hypothetical protein